MENTEKDTQNPLLKGVHGIIFDYGGTLDSRGTHWSHIIEAGWRQAGLDVPTDIFRQCYVHAERFLAANVVVLPSDSFHMLMLRKISVELEKLRELRPDLLTAQALEPVQVQGITVPRAAATAAAYCDSHARACITEARPVLEALAAHLPLVLVSNFYGNIDAVLRAYGIRHYFRGIIESAVVGVRKPDARIFMMGAVALGLPPEQVLVVGDSLRKDIEPARSLGCRTAWIKGRGWTPEEDAATDPALIPDLKALMP